MHFSYLAAVSALASAASAAVPRAPGPVSSVATTAAPSPYPTGEFFLKTQLKPGQGGSEQFDGLYVFAYHTGAGTNDAMLSSNLSHAKPAFQEGNTGGSPSYFNVNFDLDTSGVPYQLLPEVAVNIYAGWQPVRINAGGAGPTNSSSFYFADQNDLIWTNAPESGGVSSFGGWLVCQWWHSDIDNASEPGTQLFFRVNDFNSAIPDSCADVNLVAEFIPNA